ncbi:GNAT family N-acetyltransferase [Escherichia coli]|nr:GNAT family N-acetyltransferase [Escherichia coli]
MIETERLLLRHHRLDDFPAYHAMNSDPRVLEFIAAGKPLTLEESWNKFMRNAGFFPILGYGLFAVEEKASGAYVGHTGLADFHRGLGEDFDPFAEGAWAMSADVHGRGYAAEAVKGAHAWFDATFKPARTVCIIDPLNLPSLKLAEKLGYRAYDEAIYKEKRVIKLERKI